MCRYTHSCGRLSVFVVHLTYVYVLGFVLHVTKTLLHTYTIQSRIPRYFFSSFFPGIFGIFLSVIVAVLRATYHIIQFFSLCRQQMKGESNIHTIEQEKFERGEKRKLFVGGEKK
jgi:hypothetical protein